MLRGGNPGCQQCSDSIMMRACAFFLLLWGPAVVDFSAHQLPICPSALGGKRWNGTLECWSGGNGRPDDCLCTRYNYIGCFLSISGTATVTWLYPLRYGTIRYSLMVRFGVAHAYTDTVISVVPVKSADNGANIGLPVNPWISRSQSHSAN